MWADDICRLPMDLILWIQGGNETMRKLTAGILSVMMIFTFAGCAANDADQGDYEDFEDVEGYEEKGTYSGYTAEKTMGDYIILTWSCPEGPLIVYADNKTELVGAMDSTGKVIAPCEYEYMDYEGNDRYMVQKDGNYGIIDTQGNEIVPCEYANLEVDRHGKEGLVVAQKTEEGLWGYVSTEDGKTVIEPRFNMAGQFNGTDLAPVQFENEKWGYIDRKGNTVIEPKFDEAWSFGELSELPNDQDENYARVRMIIDKEKDVEKEGIIDKTGKLVLGCKYDWVMEFRNGIAIVNEMDYSNEEEPAEFYGVVDTDGNEIIPMKKDVEIQFSNNGKYLSVADINENGVPDKIRYYDLEGKKASEEKFESTEGIDQDGSADREDAVDSEADTEKAKKEYANTLSLSSGNTIVQKEKDGLWAIMGEDGDLLTDFVYNTEINRD